MDNRTNKYYLGSWRIPRLPFWPTKMFGRRKQLSVCFQFESNFLEYMVGRVMPKVHALSEYNLRLVNREHNTFNRDIAWILGTFLSSGSSRSSRVQDVDKNCIRRGDCSKTELARNTRYEENENIYNHTRHHETADWTTDKFITYMHTNACSSSVSRFSRNNCECSTPLGEHLAYILYKFFWSFSSSKVTSRLVMRFKDDVVI